MVNGHFFTTHGLYDVTNFTQTIPTTARCAIVCDPPFKAPLTLLTEQFRLLSSRLLAHVSQWVSCEIPSELVLFHLFHK